MKNTIFLKGVLWLILILPVTLNAQVRPDIMDAQFDGQRETLADLIFEFVTPEILQYHCDYTTITNDGAYDIHDDFNFLPFHRTYLEKLEDFLLEKGYPQFVPLPKWTGDVAPPTEFSTAGPDGNGVDPDCGSTTCANAGSSCSSPTNWAATVSLPIATGETTSYLSLPVQTGGNNDLCDWNMIPLIFSTVNDQTGSNGLSRKIETPWHNSGHQNLGGVMLNFRSPAAAIFWLWHAAVDDKWKEWECNCPQSTTLPFDLYMKDNILVVQHERDRGEEPSLLGDVWGGEDIWARKQNDGFTIHETESIEHYTTPGLSSFVYVQVRNRGCVPSSGTNQLKLYWIKSTTGAIWPDNFTGLVQDSDGDPMGGLIGTANIPAVKAGGSAILEFAWNPPDPANYDQVADYLPRDFCLYARIESTADPMAVAEVQNPRDNTMNNNNIAWINIIVLDDPDLLAGGGGSGATGNYYGSIYVANPWPTDHVFDLDFSVAEGKDISNDAEIILVIPNELYDIWQGGGHLSQGNIQLARKQKGEDSKTLQISSNTLTLENLLLPANTHYPIALEFNFLSDRVSQLEPEYRYSIAQKDKSDGSVLGMEHFIIRTGNKTSISADAGNDVLISQGDDTDLSAYDIGKAATYNWYDSDGTLIYTGKDFSVSPEITKKYELEVIAEIDGVIDFDEVEVKVKEFEILGMSPNPATNQFTLDYKADNASSAYVMVSMAYGDSYSYILDVSQNQTTIDVSSYQTGLYNVILVCNGQAVDASTLVVQ